MPRSGAKIQIRLDSVLYQLKMSQIKIENNFKNNRLFVCQFKNNYYLCIYPNEGIRPQK